jgi:hypothetical protein
MKLVTNHATIKDDKGRTMIFDMFVKNKELILIGSSPTPYIAIDKVSVSINDNELKLNKVLSNDVPTESYRVFFFDCNYTDSDLQVTVNYDNVCKTIVLNNINSEIQNEYKLTITTCFKGDYNLFPMWYDYYTKQGVEHFYMYYNGILTDAIKGILNKPNVTLHEWCFEYWSKYHNRLHCAQLGQMHHALYKYGKNSSEYMIYCDLDEYLYLHKGTILDKINSDDKFDEIQFRNCFCKRMDNTIPECFPMKFYIENNVKLLYDDRAKCLYNISKTNVLQIHHANHHLNNLKVKHYGINFHFKKENLPRDLKFGQVIFPDDIQCDMTNKRINIKRR